MFNPKAPKVGSKKRGKPLPMVCVYRPKKGKVAAFLKLLKKHWPRLRELGLATRARPRVWRGKGKGGETVIFEVFEWRDANAVQEAHGSPEVFEVWGPMGRVADGMEFYEAEALELGMG